MIDGTRGLSGLRGSVCSMLVTLVALCACTTPSTEQVPPKGVVRAKIDLLQACKTDQAPIFSTTLSEDGTFLFRGSGVTRNQGQFSTNIGRAAALEYLSQLQLYADQFRTSVKNDGGFAKHEGCFSIEIDQRGVFRHFSGRPTEKGSTKIVQQLSEQLSAANLVCPQRRGQAAWTLGQAFCSYYSGPPDGTFYLYDRQKCAGLGGDIYKHELVLFVVKRDGVPRENRAMDEYLSLDSQRYHQLIEALLRFDLNNVSRMLDSSDKGPPEDYISVAPTPGNLDAWRRLKSNAENLKATVARIQEGSDLKERYSDEGAESAECSEMNMDAYVRLNAEVYMAASSHRKELKH